MEFITAYLIPFVIVLTILVFVHELGHYLIAKRNGVRVEVFSIGFGPEIFGWTDRAQTRWRFSVIPLGGYVRMFGDADESSKPDSDKLSTMSEEDKAASLHHKTPMQRIAVSFGGPLANFLFALAIMAPLFMYKGAPVQPAVIGKVLETGAAKKAGLQEKDKIIKVDGQPVERVRKLRSMITDSAADSLTFTIVRGEGEQANTFDVTISPIVYDDQGNKTDKRMIGVAFYPVIEYRPIKWYQAPIIATKEIYTMCADTLKAVGEMIVRKRSSDQLGGIVSIGQMAGDSMRGGALTLLMFMAILSVNLGLINLFPIPVLDGGHILFAGIEAIIGRPVPEKVQEYAFITGALIVLGLILLTTANDLSRLNFIQDIMTSIKSLLGIGS